MNDEEEFQGESIWKLRIQQMLSAELELDECAVEQMHLALQRHLQAEVCPSLDEVRQFACKEWVRHAKPATETFARQIYGQFRTVLGTRCPLQEEIRPLADKLNVLYLERTLHDLPVLTQEPIRFSLENLDIPAEKRELHGLPLLDQGLPRPQITTLGKNFLPWAEASNQAALAVQAAENAVQKLIVLHDASELQNLSQSPGLQAFYRNQQEASEAGYPKRFTAAQSLLEQMKQFRHRYLGVGNPPKQGNHSRGTTAFLAEYLTVEVAKILDRVGLPSSTKQPRGPVALIVARLVKLLTGKTISPASIAKPRRHNDDK